MILSYNISHHLIKCCGAGIFTHRLPALAPSKKGLPASTPYNFVLPAPARDQSKKARLLGSLLSRAVFSGFHRLWLPLNRFTGSGSPTLI